MSTVRIREFEAEPEEYVALAAVDNAVYPEYPSDPDDIRYDDDHLDRTKYVLKRYLAETAGGEVVAYGTCHHMPGRFHPKRFWMSILVHPNWRRQGIGTSLYEQITDDLYLLNAIAVGASTRETMPKSIAFLGKRGFREVMRSWESRLDVTKFDFALFQGGMDRMDREGVVITTLALEKGRDPDWLTKVYDLHTAVMADVPAHTPYTPPPLAEFVHSVIESPWALLDGYFVAKHGDRYVGESFLNRNKEEPGHLYQGLTGVRREYRGQGIAMALKLRTIRYAQEHGQTLIKTWNATTNTGMLAINQKLGFVRQPAWIEYEKSLA